MNEQKLVVVVMGQDCSKFLKMNFESIKDADAIVYIDGGSDSEFWCEYNKIIEELKIMPNVIHNKYDQEDLTMNGKQRNFYLQYIKTQYPDWWCLALDADEVVEDLNKIKQFIQIGTPAVYLTHMRHFHNDLGHEDDTAERHWVINRLFKISEADKYTEVEHSTLTPKYYDNWNIENHVSDKNFKVLKVELTNENKKFLKGYYWGTTIWHLAHINHVFSIKKRYEKNMKHSNMHTPQFLDDWKDKHMLGYFPNKPIDIMDIPNIILKYFHIEKDKHYFKDRGLEVKHFIDADNWKRFFNPKLAMEIGCGLGPRVYAMNSVGMRAGGVEISEWAVKHKFIDTIIQGDITKHFFWVGNEIPDLIIAYDILEHIDYTDIEATISNIIQSTSKYILVSVPVLGDPNLEADKTHKIKETKQWWIEQFTKKGVKQIAVPDYFLFKEQLIIFER